MIVEFCNITFFDLSLPVSKLSHKNSKSIPQSICIPIGFGLAGDVALGVLAVGLVGLPVVWPSGRLRLVSKGVFFFLRSGFGGFDEGCSVGRRFIDNKKGFFKMLGLGASKLIVLRRLLSSSSSTDVAESRESFADGRLAALLPLVSGTVRLERGDAGVDGVSVSRVETAASSAISVSKFSCVGYS